jgi:hypothetical protein
VVKEDKFPSGSSVRKGVNANHEPECPVEVIKPIFAVNSHLHAHRHFGFDEIGHTASKFANWLP